MKLKLQATLLIAVVASSAPAQLPMTRADSAERDVRAAVLALRVMAANGRWESMKPYFVPGSSNERRAAEIVQGDGACCSFWQRNVAIFEETLRVDALPGADTVKVSAQFGVEHGRARWDATFVRVGTLWKVNSTTESFGRY
jgi:hypothetical protein